MSQVQKGRVLKRKRTSTARSKRAANLTDNTSFDITQSLLEEAHPTRAKQELPPEVPVIPSHIPAASNPLSPPASTKREPSDSDTDQDSPGSSHDPILLKAIFLLNGKPILLTQEILPINLFTQKDHTLELISLELFSTDKQPIALISAPSKTSNATPPYDQDSYHPVPILNTTASPNISPRTAIPIAHLLNSTSLPSQEHPSSPQSPSRPTHMHYTDNEMSPEEKMAQMSRYAYTPGGSDSSLLRLEETERKQQQQQEEEELLEEEE